MYVYVLCAYSAHGGQKSMLDALELGLQKVVSHHVVAKNHT